MVIQYEEEDCAGEKKSLLKFDCYINGVVANGLYGNLFSFLKAVFVFE